MGSKNAEKSESFIKRTNTFSMVPRKTGDNSHLAERPYDVEYKLQEIKEKFEREQKEQRYVDDLKTEIMAIQAQLSEIATDCKLNHYSRGEWEAIQLQRKKLVARNSEIAIELRQLKRCRTSGGYRGLSDLFVNIAGAVLPRDVFNQIMDAAKAQLPIEGA